LKIADVVTAPMVAGHNVIDLKRALLVRHAAEFAPALCSFEYLIPNRAADVG
jgi:hypothetical protein